MDLSAIIVIVVMTAMFFGAVLWMSIHSRKNDAEKLAPENREAAGSDKSR